MTENYKQNIVTVIGDIFRSLVLLYDKEAAISTTTLIPFIYKLHDYLTIVLPPDTFFFLECNKEKLEINQYSNVDFNNMYCETQPIFSNVNIIIYHNDPKYLSDILSRIHFLKEQLIDVADTASRLLQRGITVLNSILRKDNIDYNQYSDEYLKVYDNNIDDLLKQCAEEVLHSVTIEGDAFFENIEFMYYDCHKKAIRSYIVFKSGKCNFSRSDKGFIDYSIKNGLVSKKKIENDKILIRYPGHFGGIPWVSISISVDNSLEGSLFGVNLYRDVIVLVNERIRINMTRLLSELLEQSFYKILQYANGIGNDLIKEINQYWMIVSTAIPTRAPILKEANKQETDIDVISIGTDRYIIDFDSHIDVMLFGLANLKSDNESSWGLISIEEVRRIALKVIQIISTVTTEKMMLQTDIIASKEAAIVHYGHTLGHRLSPIIAYFDQYDHTRASANAKFLGDLSIVLQANNIDSPESLYTHEKKDRFLEYENKPEQLWNIVSCMTTKWHFLVESNQLVTVAKDVGQESFMVMLEFIGIKSAYLPYMLTDSINNKPCRLKEAFYSQLFCELLFNVVRYGAIAEDKINMKDKIAHVLVMIGSQSIQHKGEIYPVITLTNIVGNKSLPSWLSKQTWTLWPENRENNGPGMAIGVLKRLKVGQMWYKYNPAERVFSVAIWLEGITFNRRIIAMDKIKVLWIDDREEMDGTPENSLPKGYEQWFSVVHHSTSEELQSYRSTEEFLPLLKDFWFDENSDILPVEIIATDYNLAKRGGSEVVQESSIQQVARLKRSQDTNSNNIFSMEHDSHKGNSSAKVNFEGLLISLFYGSLAYKHPAAIVPMTRYIGEMPSEVDALHSLVEPFLGVDFRYIGLNDRKWENILKEGTKQLRDRIKTLHEANEIIISPHELLALSENPNQEFLTITSKFTTRRLPIAGLFIDVPLDIRTEKIKKWTKEMTSELGYSSEALKTGINVGERIWEAYYNNHDLIHDRWELSRLRSKHDYFNLLKNEKSLDNTDKKKFRAYAQVWGDVDNVKDFFTDEDSQRLSILSKKFKVSSTQRDTRCTSDNTISLKDATPDNIRLVFLFIMSRLAIYYSKIEHYAISEEVIFHALFPCPDMPLIYPWHQGKSCAEVDRTIQRNCGISSIKNFLSGEDFENGEQLLLLGLITDHVCDEYKNDKAIKILSQIESCPWVKEMFKPSVMQLLSEYKRGL